MPTLPLLPCNFQWPLFCSGGDLGSPSKVAPSVSAWSGGGVAGLGVPHLGWQKGVERTKQVRAGGDVEWI